MIKKLGISKNMGILGFMVVLITEIVSLWRFAAISKAQPVNGTEKGLFGISKDASDPQWNTFEENFIFIIALQVTFLMGSYIIKLSTPMKNGLINLQMFNIIIGVCFSIYLHSIGVVIQFIMISIFYLFQRMFQNTQYFTSMLWTTVIVVLYLNEICDGYRFAAIHSKLEFLDEFRNENQLIRWNILFNLIILRIISFSQDRNWATHYYKKPRVKDDQEIEDSRIYKNLVTHHHKIAEYNFISYLSYIYYTPLFFAGPTLTFNAFHAQLKTPQQTYSKGQVIKYVLRVYFVDLLTFVILLHICYPNAIAKVTSNLYIWDNFSLFDFHIMSFFNLVFLWYKFLTIWRITRAWALMDGIETPENMNRCIYNNYNFSGFWRSWHRSFNQWLIRYIYVPLGGSKYKVINMWVVFTFVALWHDFKLDLILWAWMICLALIPEIAVMSYFNKDYYYKKWWFKYVCGLAGAFQIEMMCLANLIGFGNGHTGMALVIKSWMSLSGLLFVVIFTLTRNQGAVWFMFYIRENEGQDKNF